jgi:Holliday junction resolvasome RuvABC endonuclease subunit
MSQSQATEKRVLAIDPTSRGFGYAVLEGPERLIDWGVVQVRDDKESACLKRIERLIERYVPDVIVLEDSPRSRRCARVRQLIDRIRQLADNKRIPARSFSRSKIRRAFAPFGAVTKSQIAAQIAKLFVELAPHLPGVRKIWRSEDGRSAIFDAVSLALTLFHRLQRRKAGEQESSAT